MKNTAKALDSNEIPVFNNHVHPYSQQALNLKRSGFLCTPAIVTLAGTERDYQYWACYQPCCISRSQPNELEPNCFVPIKRHTISYKSGYTGVTMSPTVKNCYFRHGCLNTFKLYCNNLEHCQNKDSEVSYLLLKATDQLHDWVWHTLKTKMGYQHWSDINPEAFKDYLQSQSVRIPLPKLYVSPVIQ